MNYLPHCVFAVIKHKAGQCGKASTYNYCRWESQLDSHPPSCSHWRPHPRIILKLWADSRRMAPQLRHTPLGAPPPVRHMFADTPSVWPRNSQWRYTTSTRPTVPHRGLRGEARGQRLERLEWKGQRGGRAIVMHMDLSAKFIQSFHHITMFCVAEGAKKTLYFVIQLLLFQKDKMRLTINMIQSEGTKGWELLSQWPLTLKRRWSEGGTIVSVLFPLSNSQLSQHQKCVCLL